MRVLVEIWLAITYYILGKDYFFHLYRIDGRLQLRTGPRYGKGELLAETQEDPGSRGTAVPALIRDNTTKIGERRHCWSYLGKKPDLGEWLYPHGDDYGHRAPVIGEVWTRTEERLPNDVVLQAAYDLEILEPVWPSHSMGPMVLCRDPRGTVVRLRMKLFWDGTHTRKVPPIHSPTN